MGGGGGGGSRPISRDELAKIERQARQELRGAATGGPERRNVFISFAYEDISDVRLLRGQSMNANSALEFSDRSLQQAFPTKHEPTIEAGIRDKIRQASVTVCFVSAASAQSDWVDWELRESIAMNKGIVCVYSGAQPPTQLPAAVREYNIRVVPWRHDALMSAIEAAAVERAPKPRNL